MSQRFTLNKQDVSKWLTNAVTFLAPALLVFLLEIQKGQTLEQSLLAIKIWALNTAIDLTRKFIAGK